MRVKLSALLLVLPLAAIGETSEADLDAEDKFGDLGDWLEGTTAAPGTDEPYSYPTAEPTEDPTTTAEPTPSPTYEPTTPEPTPKPTPKPTPAPSRQPTIVPTTVPTESPTAVWSNILQLNKGILVGCLISSGAVLLLCCYMACQCSNNWKEGHRPSKPLNWLFFVDKRAEVLIDKTETQKNIDYGGTGEAKDLGCHSSDLFLSNDLEAAGHRPSCASSSSSSGSTESETDSSYTDGSSYSYTVNDSDESTSGTGDSYTTATSVPSIPEEKRDQPPVTRGQPVDLAGNRNDGNPGVLAGKQGRQVFEVGADGNAPGGEDEFDAKTIFSDALPYDSGLAALAAAGFDSACAGIYGMTTSERAEIEREKAEFQEADRRSRRKRRKKSSKGDTASRRESDSIPRPSRKRSSKRRSRKRSSRKKSKPKSTLEDDGKVENKTTQNLGLHGDAGEADPTRTERASEGASDTNVEERVAGARVSRGKTSIESGKPRPSKKRRSSRKKSGKSRTKSGATVDSTRDALSFVLSDHAADSIISPLDDRPTRSKRRKHVRSRRDNSLSVSKSGPEFAYHVLALASPRSGSNSPIRKRKLPTTVKKTASPMVQGAHAADPMPAAAEEEAVVLEPAAPPGDSGQFASTDTVLKSVLQDFPKMPEEQNSRPSPHLAREFEALAASVAKKEPTPPADNPGALAREIQILLHKTRNKSRERIHKLKVEQSRDLPVRDTPEVLPAPVKKAVSLLPSRRPLSPKMDLEGSPHVLLTPLAEPEEDAKIYSIRDPASDSIDTPAPQSIWTPTVKLPNKKGGSLSKQSNSAADSWTPKTSNRSSVNTSQSGNTAAPSNGKGATPISIASSDAQPEDDMELHL